MDELKIMLKHFQGKANALNAKLEAGEYPETEEGKSAQAADETAFMAAVEECKGLQAQIDETQDGNDEAEAKSKARLDALQSIADSTGDDTPAGKGFGGIPEGKGGVAIMQQPQAKSAGELFVEGDEYKAVMENGGFSEAQGTKARGTVELKAVITSPSLPVNNRYENYAPKPLVLMEAISIIDTGADAIVVHRLVYSANNAAVTADGTAAPESDLVWQSVTLTPVDVPHWVPVDNNALNDHPTVQGMINTELSWGVRDVLQTKVMTDLDGTTGLLTQAFDTDILTTLLAGKTTVEQVRTPTGIIMNPTDVQTIQNLKGTDGHYIGGGPFTYVALVVWGLPVISSSACPVGWAFIGNVGSVIWRNRQDVTVTVGWQGTQFIERRATIMANARGFSDITLPGAMIKCDLTA